MPELPEVETVCLGLAQKLPSHKIIKVEQHRADLRIPFPENLSCIKNKTITGIERRAKYILIHLSNRQTLIIHLGMSGRLTVTPDYDPAKHDHMVLTLDNKEKVIFNDARRFGLVDLAETATLDTHKFFRHLGCEPLDKDFTADYLDGKFRSKKIAVKLAVMDQQVVVGVGNIYASEALFLAGISPLRLCNSLTLPELKKLVGAIRKTLEKAIKAGGSSLRDYVQSDGNLGYFQHQFAVYGKEGQKCRHCTCDSAIQKITQGGRSTFYCPEKQK
jgi:formamidopyrimidine-DNA glycosylase